MTSTYLVSMHENFNLLVLPFLLHNSFFSLRTQFHFVQQLVFTAASHTSKTITAVIREVRKIILACIMSSDKIIERLIFMPYYHPKKYNLFLSQNNQPESE